MALPIDVGNELAAVLLITRVGADRTFTELEFGIADLLTAQIAIALQNADLHARVADSALRDPLTGLLNRRFFDEAVETAYANARRAGSELSLIVLDLDRFSAVNNEYGHAVGDAVLRRVAKAIRGATREGDVLVRYGGEEFVVIAPATSGDGAVLAAERIRAAVAASGRRNWSMGGSCTSRCRPASPASSTNRTAAASSAQRTQRSWPQSEPDGTASPRSEAIGPVRGLASRAVPSASGPTEFVRVGSIGPCDRCPPRGRSARAYRPQPVAETADVRKHERTSRRSVRNDVRAESLPNAREMGIWHRAARGSLATRQSTIVRDCSLMNCAT